MPRSGLRRSISGRAIVLTFVSAFASPLAARGQTWTSPSLLSTAAEYNGGSGQLKEPNLTPATGGGFHVVYHVGNNGDIKYRRIDSGTYGLGTYTPVYDGVFTANTNITQAGDGSVVIGWERWNEAGVGGSGKAEIGIAKLTSGGAVQNISDPQGISTTTGFAKYPQLSSYGQAADGRVLLSYYNTSTDALRSRTSSDAGATFGPDNFLQTADIEYRVMGIAKSPVDGSVWRAYGTSNGNNTYNLKMVKFDATSQTWGAPVTIQSNIISDYYPSRMSLAVSHTGKVCVAWDSAKRWGNSSGVSAQVYSPDTTSWTPELKVFSTTPFFGNVAAVPGADNTFYVFNTNNSARDFPIVVNITDGVVNRVDEKPGGVGTYTTADFTPYVRGGIDATGKVLAAWELWANNGSGGTLNPQLFYSVRDNPVYEAGVWLGGTGNWSDASRWAGMAIPNTAAFTAKLDNNSPAVSSITLDQNATVGSVNLNPADTLGINATRTLTLTGAAASAITGTLNNAGTVTIQANALTLSGNGTHAGTFNLAAGAALNFAGGTHTLASPSGSFTGAGAVNIGGATVIASNADTLTGAALIVSSGGTVRLQAGLTKAITLNGITPTGTGKFDVTDNALVIRSMSLAQVQAAVASASTGGTWNGPGLTSTTAAGDATHATAIGFGTNAALNKSSFKGVTDLGPGDILVKYTYYGDADLTGVVTLDDFTLFLSGYQNAGTTWSQGDFDYSGQTTLDDFTLFLKGYQQQGAPLNEVEALIDSMPMSPAERSAMLAAVEAIPEPRAALSLGVGLLAIARRRSRRRRSQR
jgi:hypothetical protein